MGYPEKQYHRQETAKEYTKVYTLNNSDEILLKQEDGMLSYVSVADLKSYTRSYGSFYDTTNQSGSANTAHSMKLNSTYFETDIDVVDNTKITVQKTGVYNLQFSAQLSNLTNDNIGYDIWLAYTGSNMVDSNTQVDIPKLAAGQLGKAVAAWNWMIPMTANDYVEIKWSSNSASGILFATGSQSNPIRPGIPSVIATISQVA